MNVKLKICGMRDPANIAEVIALHPDYMGFIFYDKSPRYVGESLELPVIPQSIKKVGVFVNERTETVTRTARDYKLDFVQLHGTETPEQCETLKDEGIEVIKAFSVDENFDFNTINSFKEHVQYFLFDTKGNYFGGNAKTFDWSLLQKYDQSVPFFLSGGISPENVSTLKELGNLNIHAVDVNSGVETAPGVKDVNKIKKLKRVIDSL